MRKGPRAVADTRQNLFSSHVALSEEERTDGCGYVGDACFDGVLFGVCGARGEGVCDWATRGQCTDVTTERQDTWWKITTCINRIDCTLLFLVSCNLQATDGISQETDDIDLMRCDLKYACYILPYDDIRVDMRVDMVNRCSSAIDGSELDASPAP